MDQSIEHLVDSLLVRTPDMKDLEQLSQTLIRMSNQVEGVVRQMRARESDLPRVLSFDRKKRFEACVLEDHTSWANVVLEETGIPGMISQEERKYYSYIGQFYQGRGEVVELGPWLGCSTSYILRGLMGNPNFSGKSVHVYDDFVWRASWMNEKVSEAEQLDNHEDFQFLFDKYTIALKDYLIVEKRKISICDGNDSVPRLVWSGDPIELLYVDCGRTYEANAAWYQLFVDFFIPNSTLIIMQDWGLHRELPVKWYNQTKQFTDSLDLELQLVHELKSGDIATFLYRGSHG
jgi:hypothetical protein